jgi:release factor glutamine methyltransferase
MPYPCRRIQFGNQVFNIYENVYEPAEDTFLLADNLDVAVNDKVLDLGAGCGILGILVANRASNVLAVDLNPYAIRCAKENAKLNGVYSKMEFVQANLLSALNPNVRFTLILFNAPYLPSEEGETRSWIDRAWAGGTNGREIVDRFIEEVPAYLNPNGRVLLMQSTLTGVEETIRAFKKVCFGAKVKAEQKLPFFETLTLIEAQAAT